MQPPIEKNLIQQFYVIMLDLIDEMRRHFLAQLRDEMKEGLEAMTRPLATWQQNVEVSLEGRLEAYLDAKLEDLLARLETRASHTTSRNQFVPLPTVTES
jgi:hypothetical protein